MTEYFSVVLELSVLFPCMLLSYLPMKPNLNIKPIKLGLSCSALTLFLCLVGGAVSYFCQIEVIWVFVSLCIVECVFYLLTVNISYWKSVSVFLAVCAVFSCLGNVSMAITGDFDSDTPLSFSAGSAVLWLTLCAAFTLAAWHAATHGARRLLSEEAFAQTWYVFWGLPLLFVGINIAMIPRNPQLLSHGRLRPMYLVISLVLLFLLLLFYALFYLIATVFNRNYELRRTNQLLSMQQSRFDNLKNAISQTKENRHDMRHHFNVMQGLAANEDWESLKKYLCDAKDSISDMDLGLCENTVVDSIAGHYGSLFRKNNIPFTFELDLPRSLTVSEVDICLVMSNLLENALEASLKTAPEKRSISVKAHIHSEYMVLLSVENTFEGEIKEKNGVFQSSKRRGEGVGLQSVKHIAEKNGGYCKFVYENGVFCSNVILRRTSETA